MKIDFNGRYQAVANLIFRKEALEPNAPIRARFAKMLEEKQATAAQSPKIMDKIPEVAQVEADRSIATKLGLESYKFEVPSLEPPKNELPRIGFELTEEVKEESNSVKKPTVVSVRRITEETDPAQPDFSKVIEVYKDNIEKLGSKHGIDPSLAMSVAQAESSFNPNAVSVDGHDSKGLFQLLDQTGKEMMGRLDVKGAYTPFDPVQNSELGIGYLRYLHELFSSESELPNKLRTTPAANSASLEKLAVAAFNAGEGRVASAQQRALLNGRNPADYHQIAEYLPEITQQYVRRVTDYKQQFGGSEEDNFQG